MSVQEDAIKDTLYIPRKLLRLWRRSRRKKRIAGRPQTSNRLFLRGAPPRTHGYIHVCASTWMHVNARECTWVHRACSAVQCGGNIRAAISSRLSRGMSAWEERRRRRRKKKKNRPTRPRNPGELRDLDRHFVQTVPRRLIAAMRTRVLSRYRYIRARLIHRDNDNPPGADFYRFTRVELVAFPEMFVWLRWKLVAPGII